MKYNGEGVWEDEIHLVDVDTPVLGGSPAWDNDNMLGGFANISAATILKGSVVGYTGVDGDGVLVADIFAANNNSDAWKIFGVAAEDIPPALRSMLLGIGINQTNLRLN